MGVYIPNIEMPKDGQMLVIFPDGTAYVCFNGMRERLALAEAVPVPPHGALMDRDDFFATCPELVDGYKRITDDLVVIPAEEGK